MKATADNLRQGYTIRQVSRFDAGRYACTADNGVGMPAKAFVSLQVLCKYQSIFSSSMMFKVAQEFCFM